MTRLIACTFAAFSLAMTISPGNAANFISDTPQQTVSYADLDLSHSADAQVLLQRLQVAADNVCGGRPDARHNAQERYNNCTGQAMNGALTSVNSPLVAELYAESASKTAAAPRETVERVASRSDNPDRKPNLFQRFFAAF